MATTFADDTAILAKDSDPEKLQTNLDAIQKRLKK
jgi:hypothetical protein